MDYKNATNQQLAAAARQYKRNSGGYRCEFGHDDCGCTNGPAMSGIAPCIERVQQEQNKRKSRG